MLSNLQFRSENRFDACSLCGLRELHRAMQVADVGQGDGRNVMLLGEVHDSAGRKRRIKKRVIAADAQRNVSRGLDWRAPLLNVDTDFELRLGVARSRCPSAHRAIANRVRAG